MHCLGAAPIMLMGVSTDYLSKNVRLSTSSIIRKRLKLLTPAIRTRGTLAVHHTAIHHTAIRQTAIRHTAMTATMKVEMTLMACRSLRTKSMILRRSRKTPASRIATVETAALRNLRK